MANQKFYNYDPSKAAASAFAVLFAIATLVHAFLMIKRRTWYFSVFVIGGILETIGYIARTISATETPNWSQGPFIAQTILILIAPALFAASIYRTLSRLIGALGVDELSPIKRRRLTTVFVCGDVLSFLTQGVGGGILASAKSSNDTLGQVVIIVGLLIQLISFGLFVTVAAIFHKRYLKLGKNPPRKIWPIHIYVLYLASTLIFVRSVFRVVEYAQGNDGYLLSHEIFLYIFDSALMFAVMVIYVIWHPAILSKTLKERSDKNQMELSSGENILP